MEYIGEIYLVVNKTNNKCYVGQARKQQWGTTGRWKSHLREAVNTVKYGTKDHCVLLNQAIRKYGPESFEVKKIEDVHDENIDEREAFYIKEYNSVSPNGYNLNQGGARGKDSDETREKKRQMRLNKTHTDEVKAKISKGQLGNRREKIKRKHQEDNDLPKYIVAKRIGGVLTGYAISCFPIGVDAKRYISKTFTNKINPEEALKQAQEHLENLCKEYNNQHVTQEVPHENDVSSKPKLERNSRSKKKGSDRYTMPKYISLITVKDKEIGFMVDGLRIITDDEKIKRYTKAFTDPSKSMHEKLELAVQHLEEVKTTHNCLLDAINRT